MSLSSDDEAQKRTERRRLESEMFMLESDRDRHVRRRDEILIDIKRLKSEISRLEASLKDKEAEAIAAEHEVNLTDAELMKVKRKMNSL